MAEKAVKLLCPHCGATLDVRASMGRSIACGYCGTGLAIQQAEGTFFLSELGSAISRVQAGTDRTAAELAMRRLGDELAQLVRDRDSLRETRSSLVSARKAGLSGSVLGMGCLASIALFLAIVSLNIIAAPDSGVGWTAFVLFAGCVAALAFGIRQYRARLRAKDEEVVVVDQRLEKAETEIAACRARIERNRAIVDA